MGGIQTKKLSKLRSNAGDKVTGVDAEKALDAVFGNNYRIRLDHSILDDHGVSTHRPSTTILFSN